MKTVYDLVVSYVELIEEISLQIEHGKIRDSIFVGACLFLVKQLRGDEFDPDQVHLAVDIMEDILTVNYNITPEIKQQLTKLRDYQIN